MKQGSGRQRREARRQQKERPWLIPVVVFVAAVAFIALALIAAGDK